MCPSCAEPFVTDTYQTKSDTAIDARDGHDHREVTRRYKCTDGHPAILALRSVCPLAWCEWNARQACAA